MGSFPGVSILSLTLRSSMNLICIFRVLPREVNLFGFRIEMTTCDQLALMKPLVLQSLDYLVQYCNKQLVSLSWLDAIRSFLVGHLHNSVFQGHIST